MAATWRACVVVGLTWIGCNGGTDPTTKAASEGEQAATAAPEPSTVAAGPEAKAVQPPPPMAADAARAVLAAWLKAQNEGNLDAYSTLYAKQFAGIKRSGPRTRSFDRDGWLQDRGRMFQKAMRVTAENVQVRATASMAVVRFEQTWASGSYRDAGPKRLVLVREGEALRIAREEMLASALLGEQEAKELAVGDFWFVAGGDRAYVLLTREAAARWFTGPIRLAGNTRTVTARRDAKRDALPAELRALFGTPVRAYDAERLVCEGKLGAPVGLRRAIPHWITREAWKGKRDEPQANPAQIASDVWEMVGNDTVLAAPIESEGSCAGALWAQQPDGNETTILKGRNATTEHARAALKLARGSRAYRQLQKEFTATGGTGAWHAVGHARQRARHFRTEGTDLELLTLELSSGDTCGSAFLGEMWIVLRRTGPEGDWAVLSDASTPWTATPRSAVLLDGSPALIVEGGLVRNVGETLKLQERDPVPNFDCSC